jgi:hypothetical protein
MQDTFNSNEPKVAAIIFFDPPDTLSGKTAMKYSHVTNAKTNGVATFMRFVKRFPNARYVNFYSKATGVYLGRLYI